MCVFCRFGVLLALLLFVCSFRGLTTPAPSVLFLFTCEPSVYTQSLGFHFLLWGLVCKIVGVWCVCIGMGTSLYDMLLSMVSASVVLVRLVVFVLCGRMLV